jgi:hypothetical protein
VGIELRAGVCVSSVWFICFILDVAHVLFGYCICCNGYTHTLQVCFPNVSAVSSRCCMFSSDVVYVIVAIHICCKCIFQIFHMFQMYVASVLSGCCICRKRMFQLFCLVTVHCNRCCSPSTLTCGQARAAPGAPTTTGVVPHGGACSRLKTCACALCYLPLSRIGAHEL